MADMDMFSPLNDRGQVRLQSLRACIKRQFGPGGAGRTDRVNRVLQMPTAAASKPAPTPRTKVRRRLDQAALLTSDEIFFSAFGGRDELLATEFDLARVAAPVKLRPRVSAVTSTTATASSTHNSFGFQQQTQMHTDTHTQQSTERPDGNGFTYSSTFSSQQSTRPLQRATATSVFTSALPAPSTTLVSQLPRPARMRTPRKAAVKRSRTGESSAEKALPLQKPRLGDYNSSSNGGSSSLLAARKDFSFVTSRRVFPSGDASSSAAFRARKSPSKFQFPPNASRLLMQRQAPLR